MILATGLSGRLDYLNLRQGFESRSKTEYYIFVKCDWGRTSTWILNLGPMGHLGPVLRFKNKIKYDNKNQNSLA